MGLADLPRLPIVEKEWLFRDAESTERLHDHADPVKCQKSETGGYTGLPIVVYMSGAEMLFRRVQLLTEWRRYAALPAVLRVADAGSWVGTECSKFVRLLLHLVAVYADNLELSSLDHSLPIYHTPDPLLVHPARFQSREVAAVLFYLP